MDKARWDKISTIVDKVLTLDKHEQATYLKDTLGGQDALIEEVKEYLKAIEASEKEQFLEKPIADYKTLLQELSASEIPDISSREDFIGMHIGAYKIEKHIAEGGMSSVYLANRDDGQFEQNVAIKFINQRNISDQGKLRFKQEQKILANLRHPNVAMLIDGGVSENGRPFLILEYISGTPIDEYCNNNQLNISQRLSLFKKVLQTIEYAHSNLVIHRDIKPSNIFVTDAGEVKILDFGIAKLLDKNGEISPLETQPGQRLWTPTYAAPEQVLEKPPVTQTDIYALGGLLHKLLTNTPAFDFSNLKLHDIEQAILNDEPAGILTSVDSQSNTEIVEGFGIQKSELKNKIKYDLEAIVNKALRKEPEHRYHSVSLLLEDINRYENNLPISAKKDNLKYKSLKFYKRNKQPLLFIFVILFAVIGMVSYYTIQVNEQRNIAESEAEKARQVSNFLIGLFESTDSYSESGESGLDVRIGSVLKNSTLLIDEELKDQPEIQSDIKITLGNMYINLGAFAEAEELIQGAIQSLSSLGDESKLKLAGSFHQLANVYQETGQLDKADSLLQEALFIYEESEDGLVNKDALESLSLYGNLQWFNKGAYAKADTIMQKNLAIRLEHFSDDPTSMAVAYNDLATLNHAQGKFNEASPYYEKATEIYASALGDHPSLAVALSNYSNLLREINDLDQAEFTQRKALKIHREKTGEENIDVGLGLGNLSNILLKKGQLEEADSLINVSLIMLKDIYGEKHPYVSRNELISAKIRVKEERYEQAEKLLLDLVEDYREIYPPGHPRLSDPMLDLGELYLITGQLDLAENQLSKAFEIRNTGYPADNWRTALTMSAYGEALSKIGRKEQADSLLAKSIDILQAQFGNEDIRTVKSIDRFAANSEINK
ncbi:MAG: serine/threonine-protein kinase [Balneolaceae bacterium]